MLAVVVSRADTASVHIGEKLLELADWTVEVDDSRPDSDGGGTVHRTDGIELRTFDELHLHLKGIVGEFGDPDLLVFASRHSGETGPLLTAHATGNVGPATYGGSDHQLARAAPNALAHVRTAFEEYAPEGYDVGIECTHHGPSDVGCPSLFVELGSDHAHWQDAAGARAVARTILGLRDVAPDADRTVVGIGGGHYAPRFDRVLRETDWAVGHIAADWSLEELAAAADATRRSVLEQLFDQSEATVALVDGDYPELERDVADLGYRVVSETWLRETAGVPLAVADDVASTLGPIDEGLRFGEAAADSDDSLTYRTLPAELLAEADGIDRDRTRTVVDRHAVAYMTLEGGSRVAGEVALNDPADHDRIVEDLAAILETKYDEVAVGPDAIVARREAFDPERARDAGVPEGPAFGELAAGRPVEVDDRTVEPSEVQSARERHFPR